MATNGVLAARPIVPDMPHLVAHLALERFPHFEAIVKMIGWVVMTPIAPQRLDQS